jgi:hypothetical protein
MKTTDDLLIAFDEWREAKSEVKRCYATTDMSAGYHCYRYTDREQKAREVCASILDEIIDNRVRGILSSETDVD